MKDEFLGILTAGQQTAITLAHAQLLTVICLQYEIPLQARMRLSVLYPMYKLNTTTGSIYTTKQMTAVILNILQQDLFTQPNR